MKKITLFLLIISKWSFSQSIDVNPSGQPESVMDLTQLIQNVFFSTTNAASVSNITTISYSNVNHTDGTSIIATGEKSYAYFTHSNLVNFPLERGLVISTGAATKSEGPNKVQTLTGEENPGQSWVGDSDIQNILNNRFGDSQTTVNATIIEFDFIPIANSFSFNYVFASEEYEERSNIGSGFECSTFQDGFAFILSGSGITNDPGISGKNIALLSDGITPVSVGTIYNTASCAPPNANQSLFVEYDTDVTAANAPIIYNGRTVKLNAAHSLIPGQTYHMKLVIADRDDYALDSALFFDGAKTVDLENDRVMCSSANINIEAKGTFTSPVYSWYKNGVLIPNQNQAVLNVTDVGEYAVKIVDGGIRVSNDSVNINDLEISVLEPLNLTLIDDNTDGVQVFNLKTIETGLFSTKTSNIITYYYLNQSDAQNDSNRITTPEAFSNTSNPQAIYIRVMQEGNESGCASVKSFNLNVETPLNVSSYNKLNNNLILAYNSETNSIQFSSQNNFDLKELRLYNIIGEEVYSFKNKKNKKQQILNIPVQPNLSLGVYIVKISVNNQIISRKILIK